MSIADRVIDRIRTKEEFEEQQKQLPQEVLRIINEPPILSTRQRLVEKIRQQVLDCYERICTDLGDLGAYLHRHRANMSTINAWTDEVLIQHTFPGLGMHDIAMRFEFQKDAVSLKGWLVVRLGKDTQYFDTEEMQLAFKCAAEWVDQDEAPF